MATKKENTFRRSVHKYLPSKVHQEKTNNPFNSGTPDDYYEGDKAIAWVEYKFIEPTPARAFTPKLTALQIDWLERSFNNGVNVRVIVGTPKGAFILESPEQWESQQQVKNLRLYSRKEVAAYLTHLTTW